MSSTYKFRADQLLNLLLEVIELYEEYQRVHGYEPALARIQSVVDTLSGLDAEIMLARNGELGNIRESQVLDEEA